MKKFLFLAIAAAAMTSCSQDEVLEVAQKQAISFGQAFVGNATRATDPSYTTNSLNLFQVYGTVKGSGTEKVNIFDGDDVSRPSTLTNNTYDASVAWDCDNVQYWISGADYDFAAVAEADDVEVDDYGMPTTLTYKSADQKDLLYAENLNPTVGAIVPFTFNHLLAKANFIVTNTTDGENTEYTYTIQDIKITNSITEGVYDIEGEEWTATTTGATAFNSITVGNKTTADCLTEVLFVPNTSYTITYTVVLKKGNEIVNSDTYSKDNIEMVAGHAYNFKLSVGLGQPIEFTVTDAPTWTSAPDITL